MSSNVAAPSSAGANFDAKRWHETLVAEWQEAKSVCVENAAKEQGGWQALLKAKGRAGNGRQEAERLGRASAQSPGEDLELS